MDKNQEAKAFADSLTNREYEMRIREPTPMPEPDTGKAWGIIALIAALVVGVIIGAWVF